MTGNVKYALIVLGVLAAALIVMQLVLAVVILNGGSPGIRTAHQHSGYLMGGVSLAYVLGSLAVIASIPTRSGK